MRCFVHSEASAVGICKNCNRGICLECAADLKNGLACKNRCEAAVSSINSLADQAPAHYASNARAYFGMGLVFAALGGGFIYESFSDRAAQSGSIPFLLIAGIPIVAFALFSVRTALSLRAKARSAA